MPCDGTSCWMNHAEGTSFFSRESLQILQGFSFCSAEGDDPSHRAYIDVQFSFGARGP